MSSLFLPVFLPLKKNYKSSLLFLLKQSLMTLKSIWKICIKKIYNWYACQLSFFRYSSFWEFKCQSSSRPLDPHSMFWAKTSWGVQVQKWFQERQKGKYLHGTLFMNLTEGDYNVQIRKMSFYFQTRLSFEVAAFLPRCDNNSSCNGGRKSLSLFWLILTGVTGYSEYVALPEILSACSAIYGCCQYT